MLANWIIEDAYIGRFIFCFIYDYVHFLSFLPAHIKTVKYDVKNGKASFDKKIFLLISHFR